MSKTTVPAIPAVTPTNIQDVAAAVKNLLDIREGLIGDPLDANVTYRDLLDIGVVQLNAIAANTALAMLHPPVYSSWSEADGYDPTQDFSPPQQPENFIGTSGLATVILQWDNPRYRNHSYTEVWRSLTNSIGTAVLLGTSNTNFYTDSVGATSKTYYYWIRFVSLADVVGAYNGTNGVSVSTGTVGGSDLADLIVTAGKLADSSVTATKIANLAVGTAAIASAAITNAKLANLAVDTAKIADGSIVNAKIGDLAVTNAKIDNASITTAKIADAAITTAKIYDAAITTAKIGDAQITNAKIGGVIKSTDFAAGSAGWQINKDGAAEFNNATFRGTLSIKSGASGARMETTNSVIKVFDSSGTLRVKLGDLSA